MILKRRNRSIHWMKYLNRAVAATKTKTFKVFEVDEVSKRGHNTQLTLVTDQL